MKPSVRRARKVTQPHVGYRGPFHGMAFPEREINLTDGPVVLWNPVDTFKRFGGEIPESVWAASYRVQLEFIGGHLPACRLVNNVLVVYTYQVVDSKDYGERLLRVQEGYRFLTPREVQCIYWSVDGNGDLVFTPLTEVARRIQVHANEVFDQIARGYAHEAAQARAQATIENIGQDDV